MIDCKRDRELILKQYLFAYRENSLMSLNPVLSSQWNYERNGTLTPSMFKPFSMEKVWWKCPEGHEWQAAISERSSGYGCPYCSGKRVLKGYNDLATVNLVVAREWNIEKNNDLTPEMVTAGCGKKVWWKCQKGHEWQARISDRTIKGANCPYCAGKKVLKGFNDLGTINPELAKEWNFVKNDNLAPSDVTANTNKKVWWKGQCGHEWQASIADRNTRGTNGCPFCSNHRVLIGFNDFASQRPGMLSYWDYSANTILPTELTPRSGKKVSWLCPTCGRKWISTPHDFRPCCKNVE